VTLWYIARGAGLSALLLLTISTCVGALATRPAEAANRVVVQYLHRCAATLGLTVLALHVTTILADSYAHVGWRGAIVPFASTYRPAWVALGTLAVYTFVVVAVLGYARGRIATSRRGATMWRWLHGLAYVGWASAMLHGLKSGSDSSLGWVRWLYVACAVAVVGSVIVRVGVAKRPQLARTAIAR
jgi:methionine sulfoxide reductase heme-binding subunit